MRRHRGGRADRPACLGTCGHRHRSRTTHCRRLPAPQRGRAESGRTGARTCSVTCASPDRCRDGAGGRPGLAVHAYRPRPGRARARTFGVGASADVAAGHACDRERDRDVVSTPRALYRVAGGLGHAAYFPAPGRSALRLAPPGGTGQREPMAASCRGRRRVRHSTPTRYGQWMRSFCTPSRPSSRQDGSRWARLRNRSRSCSNT